MSQLDGERLDEEERAIFCTGQCPDCFGPLTEGPHGGLSVNVLCTTPSCGSKFNWMGPFGVDRISDAKPFASFTG